MEMRQHESYINNELFQPSVGRIEIDQIPENSIFVTLSDRAVALEGIMNFISKNNMTKGSREQIQIKESSFNERYKDGAETVQAGAERKRHELFDGFVDGIHTLNAGEAKRQAGYDEEDVRLQAISLKKAINDTFLGTGKSVERKRAVDRAKRAAER